MKKLLSAFLILSLIVAMTACSSNPDSSPAGGSSQGGSPSASESDSPESADSSSPIFDSGSFAVSPSLSSDPYSGQLQLLNDVYTMPFPVQELLDNGWINYEDRMDLGKIFNIRESGVVMLQHMVDDGMTQIQLTFTSPEDGTAVTGCMITNIEYYSPTPDTVNSVTCPAAFPGGLTGYDLQEKAEGLYPEAKTSVAGKTIHFAAVQVHEGLGLLGNSFNFATEPLDGVETGGIYSWTAQTLSLFTSLGNDEYGPTEYPY